MGDFSDDLSVERKTEMSNVKDVVEHLRAQGFGRFAAAIENLAQEARLVDINFKLNVNYPKRKTGQN